MYLNKIFIIGNLTRDPETKALPSGSKLCQFGVATNRFGKDKDGNKQEYSEFHNVIVFSKLGELAGQYLKKGQQVLVEGRIQTRSWDGQDGQKRYRTEIVAENIQFGQKSSGSYSGKQTTSTEQPASTNQESSATEDKIDYPKEEISPEDIPF